MKSFSAAVVAAAVLVTGCAGPSFGPTVPSAPLAQDQSVDAGSGFSTFSQNPGSPLPALADATAYAEYTTHAVNGKTYVVSGPLGDAPLSCDSVTGTGSDTLPAVQSPYVTSKSAANDKFVTAASNGRGTVTSTSTLENVSILKGLITAQRIRSVAVSHSTATTGTSQSGGSFLHLVIDGKKMPPRAKANTQIALKGYGYVILNSVQGPVNNQKASNGAIQTNVQVNMITVVVTDAKNPRKVPTGTTIVVGSAYTSFTIPPAPYAPGPASYSLYATGYDNNAKNISGPWDSAGVACNSYYAQNVEPGTQTQIGPLGAMINVATANTQSATTTTNAVSGTKSANLLKGLIVGSGIHVTAEVDRNGSAFTNTGSLTFTSLSIDGTALTAPVAANTRIDIKGLGYIMVNEESAIPTSNGMTEEVNAVHVYVTEKGNKYKLAAGGQVILGHAHAQISPVTFEK